MLTILIFESYNFPQYIKCTAVIEGNNGHSLEYLPIFVEIVTVNWLWPGHNFCPEFVEFINRGLLLHLGYKEVVFFFLSFPK